MRRPTFSILLILVALCTLVSLTWADPRSDARTHYIAGQKAYAASDYKVAIKEFSGDIRRVLEIKELCDIDVISGADDLLFESLVVGATGWFAGYPNAFPREAVEIYDLVKAEKIPEALELYTNLVAVFRWDSKTEFVQAIKLSVDLAGGSYGGPTRPPRGPLNAAQEAQVRADTKKALDYLSTRRVIVAA